MDKVKWRVVHPRLFNIFADEGHVGHAGGNVGLDETQVRANDLRVWVAAGELDGPYACGVEIRFVVMKRQLQVDIRSPVPVPMSSTRGGS